MLIGGISSISSIAPALSPVLAVKPASGVPIAPPSSAASGTSSAAQSSPAQPAAPTHTATASATPPRDGGTGAATASAAAASAEQMIGVYSTTVGGQQYSGTVEESDGVYTVSVQNIPYATATGANEMAAENNLNSAIDELV